MNQKLQLANTLSPSKIKYLQRTIGNRSVANLVGMRAEQHARGVIQRLTTQIIDNPDSPGRILDLRIVGRPEKVFGNSMGDHSTAFATHIESLKSRLIGRTYWEAIEALNLIFAEAQTLPGNKLIDKLPPQEKRLNARKSHGTRLAEAKDKVIRIKGVLPSNALTALTANQTGVALKLQEYINAYLDYRELIPLSAVNVMYVSPGSAGKGKGESKHAGTLAAFERDLIKFEGDLLAYKLKTSAPKNDDIMVDEIEELEPENPVDNSMAQLAYQGVFDAKAAALASSEMDQFTLSQIAPGLQITTPIKDRINLMIAQHVASMKMSFPKLSAYFPVNTEALFLKIEAELKAWIDKGREQQYNWYYRRKENLIYLGDDSRDRKEKDKLFYEIDVIDWKIKQMNAIVPDSKASSRPKINKKVEIISKPPVEEPSKKRTNEVLDKSEDEEEIEETTPKKGRKKMIPRRKEESDVSVEQDKESEEWDAEERKQTLATQIILNDENVIEELNIGGRSPSPLGSLGMGAHTTAWVVHLDRIRQALIGETVDGALDIISEDLVKEAYELENDLKQASPALEPGQLEALNKASGKLQERGEIDYTASDNEASKAFILQEYINDLLTYINFIPGVTRWSADTGGKSEGKHRRILLDFEKSGKAKATKAEKEKLSFAIMGLLDVKNLKSKDVYEAVHNKEINKAYPKSAAAVFGPDEEFEVPDYGIDIDYEELEAEMAEGTTSSTSTQPGKKLRLDPVATL